VFVILPLMRLLARHGRGWVVTGCVAVLAATGAGVTVAGLAAHQPIVTRTGILILLAAVVIAVRARRPGPAAARRTAVRRRQRGRAPESGRAQQTDDR
jgi:hypothetical protein